MVELRLVSTLVLQPVTKKVHDLLQRKPIETIWKNLMQGKK